MKKLKKSSMNFVRGGLIRIGVAPIAGSASATGDTDGSLDGTGAGTK